jgi:hypothetical protein
LALLTGGDLLVLLSGANDTGSGTASRPGGDRVGAVPVRRPLATTRRTAVGGALLGLGATGCRPDRSSSSTGAGGGSPAAGQDPDAALVAEVLAELTALSRLTAYVAGHVPALRGPARALEDLHRAHRKVLGDEVPTPAPGGGPRPADAATALRLLRRRELEAQRRLVDWSVAARSGALARLLASMSAGVSQQVANLPERPHPAGGGR